MAAAFACASQAEATLCSRVLEDAKRIHVCSIWLQPAPHDAMGYDGICMILYDSKIFYNSLNEHVKSRMGISWHFNA